MSSDQYHDVLPPRGCGMRDWPDVALFARKRYARRRGRPADDPDVLDYGQEVVLRTFRRFSADAERYAIPDEFLKLVRGIMKNVARERSRALGRWKRLVTSIAQCWDEFVSSPDSTLLEWRDSFDLIRIPVEARSDEKTFEAFRLVQFEGIPTGEVAHRLGMSPQAVYSARHNVLERLVEEEGFIRLERLLYQVRGEPVVREAIAEARSRCPRAHHALIDRLYAGPAPIRPDQADADPRSLYQARAAFLREIEPLLTDICRREEGAGEF